MGIKKLNWKKIGIRVGISLLVFILLGTVTIYFLLSRYKQQIKTTVIEAVQNEYGLELKLQNIQLSLFSNWPHASMRLKGVSLKNNTQNQAPFLKAGSIYLSFNLRKALNKEFIVNQVTLENASLNLKIYSDGRKNYAFKSKPKDSLKVDTKVHFAIKKIQIKNTSFSLMNELKKQRFYLGFKDIDVRLVPEERGAIAEIDGKMRIGGLIFKSANGAFFKNSDVKLKLIASFDVDQGVVCVYPPSKILVANEEFEVASLIQYKKDKRLHILINSEKVKLSRAANFLSPNIQKTLSNFNLKNPLKVEALISVALGEAREPVLIIRGTSKNNALKIGQSEVEYSSLDFDGKIISITSDRKYGNAKHAFIVFTPIVGKIYNQAFTASVIVNSFQAAQIDIKAGVNIEAEKLKFEISKKLLMTGSCLMRLNYSGPANKLTKQSFLDSDVNLVAQLDFEDFYFQPFGTKNYFKLNGKSTLNNQTLSITKLNVITNGGQILVNGKAYNFANYALGLSSHLEADLIAGSTVFDLSPYFGEKSKDDALNSKAKRASKKKTNALVHDKLDISLQFQTKQLSMKGLKAYNTIVSADYKNENLFLRNVEMDLCGGKLQAKGTLKHMKVLDSQLELKNVDVKDLFHQMDNFGQESIRAEHLAGTLNMQGDFGAFLDKDGKIMNESMTGELKLKLSEGRLINFEPLQNISKYVFRNRDFKDISFTEINEKFYLKGNAMKIEEMELASSVMNMYLSGVFHFTENSTLNILVPWSNLRHRGKDYEAKSSGELSTSTKGVKLNYSGPPKKMKMGIGYKKVEF